MGVATEDFVRHLSSVAGDEAAAVVESAVARGLVVVTTDPTPLDPRFGEPYAKRLSDPFIRYSALRLGLLTEQEWDRLWQILQAIPVEPVPLEQPVASPEAPRPDDE
jgi:hypothetical protein